jgi:hypothetical protein
VHTNASAAALSQVLRLYPLLQLERRRADSPQPSALRWSITGICGTASRCPQVCTPTEFHWTAIAAHTSTIADGLLPDRVRLAGSIAGVADVTKYLMIVAPSVKADTRRLTKSDGNTADPAQNELHIARKEGEHCSQHHQCDDRKNFG